MRRLLTACFLLLAATANAQPRPGAFTTLSTTGTITDGGSIVITGCCANTITASSNATLSLAMRNTSNGNGAFTSLLLGNDLGTTIVTLSTFSSNVPAVAYRLPNSGLLLVGSANGLSIAADNPTGAIRFYTGAGAGTEAMRVFPSTGLTIGGTTDAGAKSLLVDGGGTIATTGVAFASLPTPSNGTMIFCTDCNPATSPCTATGSGSMAFRQNGAWKCF